MKPMKYITYPISIAILLICTDMYSSTTPHTDRQNNIIDGYVFVDVNANGTFDASDIPLSGASVAAFPGCDENATPITTTTGDDGTYSFQNLPFPPNQWLIMLDPNGEVNCSDVRECVTIDPCDSGLCEVFFPCPPPDCSSNPFFWDNDCESAYDMPLCDLQVIGDFPCGQNPTQLGPWAGQSHCNGVYHNTSFYGFVAGPGSYTINFQIFACAGAGVQYAIMEECSPGGPFVVCNGNANTGTVSISSDILVPCRTYIFWIDGFSGSVCSYYAFVSGDWQNCSVPDIMDISLDTYRNPLCTSNQPITLTATGDPSGIPPIEEINNAEYTWTINGPLGTTSYVIEGPLGLTTEYTFDQEGTYKVCIQTYHPCSGFGNPYCEEYTVSDIPNQYKEFKVCDIDFPWYGTVDANGDPLIDESGNPIVDAYGHPWYTGQATITLDQIQNNQTLFFTKKLTSDGCLYMQTVRFIIDSIPTRKIDNYKVCIDELPFAYNDSLYYTEQVESYIKTISHPYGMMCDTAIYLDLDIIIPGQKCDDGDKRTYDDRYDENCICKGKKFTPKKWPNSDGGDMVISPNPSFDGHIDIYSRADHEIENIDILTADGRRIHTYVHKSIDPLKEMIKLDISFLPQGVYFLRMGTSEAIYVRKIVLWHY